MTTIGASFRPPGWTSQRVTRALQQVARAVAASAAAVRSADADASLDLLAWGQRYLPLHFSKPPSAMHRWLAEHADAMQASRGAKVNLIGPRGGAKSTVGTLAAVLRAAVTGREKYIWIVSATHSQAHNHLANLKHELTDNRRLAAAYPAATGPAKWWRASSVRLGNDVVIEAFGVGQRLRGRRMGAARPSLIVCDDLEDDRHIASAAARDVSRQWFFGTLLKAGAAGTNVINLATSLHRDALAPRLHQTPGWASRVFASIEEWPTEQNLWAEWERLYCLPDEDAAQQAAVYYEANRDAMHAGVRVLWPESEDLLALMRQRVEGGVTAFEREKQGCPIDPERCEWPAEYFGEHAWFDDWPDGLRLRVMALDPSKGGDARHGDYSAYVLLGVGPGGVLYIDADLARRPTAQMVADGVGLLESFRPRSFGVEANQWQQLLAAEFQSERARRGLLGQAIAEIHNHTSKAMRIRRLGPYLSQRRLRFRRGSPGARLLVEQLQDFPLASHDDGPDALEMAVRLAEEIWQSG
ncbi:Terminase-like family protein [Posidoniimonas polymericola]|uniref:Terminase-like family protein n=1 Tax=Posidoniimonas polymericola TaxID=2528002 RepID=A0A5C5ZFG2_9BACT|nr:hypothetical protein [Posidoniimonas polymericola]TWT85581.1 Terminase-like family protein [Posidoniimonas polymericola]